MMASNFLSRLGQPKEPGDRTRAFYDELRGEDDELDVEERAAYAIDEQNLQHEFHDDDFRNAPGLTAEDSHITSQSSNEPQFRPQPTAGPSSTRKGRRRDGQQPGWPGQHDDGGGDNDVPASLLVESHDVGIPPPITSRKGKQKAPRKELPLPGPATKRNRAHWEATQGTQRLHPEESFSFGRIAGEPRAIVDGLFGNRRERALWRWANVSNLDIFVKDVYAYYLGNGLWCMVLDRVLHLV
jgi:autophagy-related protein 9